MIHLFQETGTESETVRNKGTQPALVVGNDQRRLLVLLREERYTASIHGQLAGTIVPDAVSV